MGSKLKQKVNLSERDVSSKSLRSSGHCLVVCVVFFFLMYAPVSQNIRKSGLKVNVSLDKVLSSTVSETSNKENPTLLQEICSRPIFPL